MKNNEKNMERRIGYSVHEFANMLGMSVGAVRMLIHRRTIPAVKLGRRVIIPASFAEAIRTGKWANSPRRGQK